MRRLYLSWRWYTLGKSEYTKSMDRLFFTNLNSLYIQNTLLAILVTGFFFFPVFFDKDYGIAITYCGVVLFAAFFSAISAYLRKQHRGGKPVSRTIVYALIAMNYSLIVYFGVFLSVIINPLRPASVYLPIIVAGLFFYTISPLLNLTLTLIGWFVFIGMAIVIKTPDVIVYEVTNSAAAIALSLILSWHGSMLRITSEDKTISLEQERDTYQSQSTVDELTSLKNRRDFMQRLDRYFNRPRHADDSFCLAIADIDYFKKYNDLYGHNQGDECLRAIGKVLGDLGHSKNIYAARLGGEEFALLWFIDSSTDVEGDLQQIHDAIKELNIPHEDSDVATHVTLSIGAYVLNCGFEKDYQVVYERADKALYKAKHDGRNRIIINDAREKGVETL